MDFSDNKPGKTYGKKFGGHEYKKREPGSSKPLSFKSTCADCGNACEVPFKPSGRKPVLCAKCFNKDGTAYSDKPWEKGAARIAAKKLFPSVCDRCSNACEVPFEPVAGRPVYCANCLGHGDKAAAHDADRSNEQFTVLNAKLDQILKLLAERE